MSIQWIKKSDYVEEKHILILHSKCQRHYEDFYLADMILSLLRSNKKITLCTTQINSSSPINNVEDENDNLFFMFPWNRLPRTLFGLFSNSITQLIIVFYVFRIILSPPSPRPNLIITDINSSVISLLKMMGLYKVIYVQHFLDLHAGHHFYPPGSVIPSTFADSMPSADDFIVYTECLKNMLETCQPTVNNTISVLHPCYETGLWMYDPFDVRSILSTLPAERFLFVVFGEFKSRTNLSMILQAMDHIIRCTEITFSVKVHLVIAGYAKRFNFEEYNFYLTLKKSIKAKMYANNVTLLWNTNVLEQKTLLENCTAVLNPTNYNVFPGSILMAMNMKRPIVSVDTGFAAQVLKHNVTGFLLSNFPSVFATKMEELAKFPRSGAEVAENAKLEFDEKYNFHMFRQRLNEIVDQYFD